MQPLAKYCMKKNENDNQNENETSYENQNDNENKKTPLHSFQLRERL